MVTAWWPRRNDTTHIQTDFRMSELMKSTVPSRTLNFLHVFMKQYSKCWLEHASARSFHYGITQLQFATNENFVWPKRFSYANAALIHSFAQICLTRCELRMSVVSFLCECVMWFGLCQKSVIIAISLILIWVYI